MSMTLPINIAFMSLSCVCSSTSHLLIYIAVQKRIITVSCSNTFKVFAMNSESTCTWNVENDCKNEFEYVRSTLNIVVHQKMILFFIYFYESSISHFNRILTKHQFLFNCNNFRNFNLLKLILHKILLK